MVDSKVTPRARNAPGQGARLREDIVTAAAELLRGGTPASSLSLRAVAKRAGITAPAIYAHFTGLDEILAAVVARRFADFSSALADAVTTAPASDDPRELLLTRTLAYCRFGLDRPADYALLFGAGDAHAGVPYEHSAGERSFTEFVAAVAHADPRVDAFATAAVLWPALHGLVSARLELSGFPWPPLEDQVTRLVDALVPPRP